MCARVHVVRQLRSNFALVIEFSYTTMFVGKIPAAAATTTKTRNDNNNFHFRLDKRIKK